MDKSWKYICEGKNHAVYGLQNKVLRVRKTENKQYYESFDEIRYNNLFHQHVLQKSSLSAFIK